jgi:hypothetical protein
MAWSTFGRRDFIRVPLPAARITIAVSVIFQAIPGSKLCHCVVSVNKRYDPPIRICFPARIGLYHLISEKKGQNA